MSRIGKLPIVLPAGVTAEINGQTIAVKGPKGELKREFSSHIAVEEEKLVLPKDYDVPESMTLKAGECGFIRMTPAKDAMTLLKRDSDKPVFEAEDPQIAEIDANGYVHALQAGTTKVTITDEELGKTWTLTLTVE